MTSRWRRSWGHLGWIRVFAGVVLVLGAVTYLNIVSHERGLASNRTSAHLQSLGLLLHEESALQWKALADRSAPIRVAREVGTIRGREKEILALLDDVLPDATNRELSNLITEYHAVLDQELGLLVVGLTKEAAELEWAETDPKFKELSERIASLSADAVAQARSAKATADNILIAAMVFTAVV
ncbi:MAG TPA: hypothetical protein VFO77_08765, partial [Actinoplanes sp.]|nr:hypothetical protein [Actinoplanes sp.]